MALIDTKIKKLLPQNTRVFAIAILALMVGFAMGPGSALIKAANTDDLEREKAAQERKLEQLSKQIDAYQSQINTTVKQVNSLKNQIALFDARIKQTEVQMEYTNTKIEVTADQITQLNQEIEEKEVKIYQTKQSLAQMIRQLYAMDNDNAALMALVNNNSLSDFLNEIVQLENLQGKSYELLQEIKLLKKEMEDKKIALEEESVRLKTLKGSLSAQRESLSGQIAAKNQLLAQTKGQEARYKQLLAASKAEEEKIEQEIQNLENQIRKQLGEKVSPARKGLFYWPMQGWMTQRYGNTGFTSLGYNFHNGIDIAAAAGTPIYAAYDGTVTATGSGEAAYGNWITIRHDLPTGASVITLYAHLMKIYVSPGETVKGGTVIGAEGNTGNTTRLLYGPHRGFHLHFTVFDVDGFRIVPGAHQSVYGPYRVPVGYTYDPMDFL